MFRGLATISYFADDLTAARDWYTRLLGTEPYFVRELDGRLAYVEFRIGDYQHELGFIDRRFAPNGLAGSGTPAGAIVHWHVDDLEATVARLIELGATPFMPVTEHGPGFVTASVIDPFGNVLGVMYNPHYVEMLGGPA